MNKPTLTPHADQLERAIPPFIERIRADGEKPGFDRVVAQMTELIVPAALRAVAQQRDMRVPIGDIMRGFHGAIANAIMSTVCTVAHVDDVQSPKAMLYVATSMRSVDEAIGVRFGDPDLVKDGVVSYDYANPDLAPGRA